MSEGPGNTPQKIRNARACEACRSSKSRCFFRDSHQIICQRCEQSGYTCVVRTKARPLRARAVRPTSTAQNITPRPPESEFSLDLPSTPAPNSMGDVRDLHEHHKEAFGDFDSDSKDDLPNDEPKVIEKRKLDLQEAEELLAQYRHKAPFFPFVVIPAEATVPLLARTSPFLLLAIFTAASSTDPSLRHQTDQEFRRILSAKIIIDGRKSLDYLQGLLVYIAWYPTHSKPKSNQTFMYVNLAVSLAIDLGLNSELPNASNFHDVSPEGLVIDGSFTQAARRAYLGAYYVSAALSLGFQKPNNLQYRNLMESQGESLLQDEIQTEVTALITLQRLTEKIAVFHRNKVIDPDDPTNSVSAELNVQIFQSELDEWRMFTPEHIRNLPNIAIAERFASITIYSHELGFLRRPYRKHLDTSPPTSVSQAHLSHCLSACKSFFEHLLSVPETLYLHFCTLQWSLMVQATLVLSRLTFSLAATRGWDADTTRANVPMIMYLDALCYRFHKLSPSGVGTTLFVFRMVLESLKVSYSKRVAAIVPQVVMVETRRSHCPIFDPELKQYFEQEGESHSYGSSSIGSLGAPTPSSTASIDVPVWHDLWATMTCTWAEEVNYDDMQS